MSHVISKRKVVAKFVRLNNFFISFAFLALLLSNFLNVLLPLSIGWFYEIVLHEHGTKSRLLSLIPVHFSTPKAFYFFFAFLLLIKAIFVFLEKSLTGIIGERFSRDLREMTFAHQLNHSLSTHLERPVGKYLLRYSGDLLAIQNLLTKGILVFIGDLFFLLIAFASLIFIQQKLALLVIISFIISGGVMYLLSKIVRTTAWNRRSQRSKNLGFVSSRMHAFYTIKSFNRESPEVNSFVKRSGKLYELGVKFMNISALVQALLPLFFFGTLLIIFYQVSLLRSVKPYGITKSDVFIFILLLLYMQGVMKRLLKVNLIWQVGIISFNKLLSLVQAPSEPRDGIHLPKDINGTLAFENVTFAYNTDKPVLHAFSCLINANSITLINGQQGMGKSTFFKLIQKVYEPQGGKILLNNTDYDNLSPFEIRKEITIVSAEAPLLGSTVFKAVSYTTADEKREKVIDILNRLQIRFVDNEEENLEFNLEDGGRNISAGQRIMLQFARAFLSRKKIILLDEPFTNLDESSRNLIILQLNKLKSKRTILIITQDVPTNLLTDQIIEL